jgi:hypothetical protein
MKPMAMTSARHALLGLALIAVGLPLVAAGCGGESGKGTGMMVVDQDKVKADQDSMRAAMEKANQAPAEARRKR